MDDERGVIEPTKLQGSGEELPYTVDVALVGDGSAPSSPTMKVYEVDSGEDVTETVTTGSMSVDGTVITTKRIKSLTKNKRYLVIVYYTQALNSLFNFFFIRCKDPI